MFSQPGLLTQHLLLTSQHLHRSWVISFHLPLKIRRSSLLCVDPSLTFFHAQLLFAFPACLFSPTLGAVLQSRTFQAWLRAAFPSTSRPRRSDIQSLFRQTGVGSIKTKGTLLSGEAYQGFQALQAFHVALDFGSTSTPCLTLLGLITSKLRFIQSFTGACEQFFTSCSHLMSDPSFWAWL